jgi:hypothetical protein
MSAPAHVLLTFMPQILNSFSFPFPLPFLLQISQIPPPLNLSHPVTASGKIFDPDAIAAYEAASAAAAALAAAGANVAAAAAANAAAVALADDESAVLRVEDCSRL